MILNLNGKSLIVGLVVGLATVFMLGAVSSRNEGVYQLSMTANASYVVYGRIHTGTGRVETWKYLIGTHKAVPHLGDDTTILLGPDGKKLK